MTTREAIRTGGFFDFVAEVPPYDARPRSIHRLNRRRDMIVTPFLAELKGARVLDLAAHDGRWSYALAAAGAASVTGVEARPELIARFAGFPETPFKPRVSLRQGDIFEYMETAAKAGERFDVVAVFGIFYHIIEHFRLLQLARALGPKLIVVDSTFFISDLPMIKVNRERTDKHLNAAPQVAGQAVAVSGVASFKAMEFMAEALGFRFDWVDAAKAHPKQRFGVEDYFAAEGKRRQAIALRPV